MTTATQEETEVRLATPGQVRHIMDLVIPKDMTHDRAKFLIESGGLPDLMMVNPETFDRDKSALVNGIRPYKICHPQLLGPHPKGSRLHFFNEFRMCHRASSGVAIKIDQGIRDLDVSPYDLSSLEGKYHLLKFDRFIPDLETVRGFLERDGFVPANFHELLAYMYCYKEARKAGVVTFDLPVFVIGSDDGGTFPCFRWYGKIIILELCEYCGTLPRSRDVFRYLLVKED